jgi:hypothetical protein
MRAPREAYRDLFFLVTRPYLCPKCGLLFELPYGVGAYVACAIIAATAAVFAVARGVGIVRELPLVSSVGTTWDLVLHLSDMILGSVAILGAIWIIAIVVRSARRSWRARGSDRRNGSPLEQDA